jgi:DNA repair protein RadC
MRIYEAKLTFALVRESSGPDGSAGPEMVVEYMRDAFETNPLQEACWVCFLNAQSKPTGRILVSLGSAQATVVHPREVFRPAILANAMQIVLCHNHPSGSTHPSSADLAITKQVKEAGQSVGITLADHIIFGDPTSDKFGRGWTSMAELGYL